MLQMVVSQIFLTVAVICSCYYDDKKSPNMKLTENNNWKIMVSKNNDLKPVITADNYLV